MISAVILCVALNVYYEAGSEPFVGQLAVAKVTLNRARLVKKHVCDVVFEPNQFSWTGKSQFAPHGKGWKQAIQIAKTAIEDKYDLTSGATYFHRWDVRPHWSKHNSMTFVGQFGQHLFYKENNHRRRCYACLTIK